MIYWFPEHPLLPVEMEYSAAKYEKDEKELSSLVDRDQLAGWQRGIPKDR